jgi:hypothetical protein
MSADVYSFTQYNADCDECATGAGPFIDEDEAHEWAAAHDAENHETDTSDDDAYEAFKEARYDG